MNEWIDFVKRLLGERNLGRLDYFLKPRMKESWGGAFNGQSLRLRIFNELMGCFRFHAIIETGTYRGSTTNLFASTQLPVYSVEVNPRFYAYSRSRFWLLRNRVKIFLGDSPTFLKTLANDPRVPKTRVFFYLDAHWRESLPLADELNIIFTTWREAIVMVDDFQVPNTTYGYDDYGGTNILNLAYLDALSLRLTPFFPAFGPEHETGKKRGCVVLVYDKTQVSEILKRVPTLVTTTNPAD